MSNEKSTTTVHVAETGAHDAPPAPEAQWAPGKIARFPTVGLGALFGVLVAAGAAALTLGIADGRSSSHWPKRIPPNVILAVINAVANLCLAIAISQGVAIAWWRKALHGATVSTLHRSWAFSASIKELVFGFQHFNMIALAALAAKVAILDSILLQKAFVSKVGTDNAVQYNDILGVAAHGFPTTGGVASYYDTSIASITDNMRDISGKWIDSNGFFEGMHLYFPGCEEGTCYSWVNAAGWDISCTSNESSYDWASKMSGLYKQLEDLESEWSEVAYAYETATASSTSTATASSSTALTTAEIDAEITAVQAQMNETWPVFSTNWYDPNSDSLTANHGAAVDFRWITPKEHPNDQYACPYAVHEATCKMFPAVVRYPITINNHTSHGSKNGVTLGWPVGIGGTTAKNSTFDAEYKQIHGYEIVQSSQPWADPNQLGNVKFTGGLVVKLKSLLESSANMTYNAALNDYLEVQSGIVPDIQAYTTTINQCGWGFENPRDFLINKANQLAFAVSVLSMNITTTELNKGLQVGTNYTITDSIETELVKKLAGSYASFDRVHYSTNWGFLAGAIASMLVCVICVLPSYWGYWELGRPVSLGPFEIASAFMAPVLEHSAAKTGDVKVLMKEVGEKKVQFGVVDASAVPVGEERLAIAEQTVVRRINSY